MKSALDRFLWNVGRVRDLGALEASLRAQTTNALDLTDLLRSQIVLLVSALDYYVHEIVLVGMVATASGARPAADGFLRFQMSMSVVTSWMQTPGDLSHFEQAVREHLGYQTFQQPDRIADGVRLIYAGPLWEDVATALGRDTRDVKIALKLLVERRNRIAHEADMDPTFPGQRWPISSQDVAGSIDFVESLVRAVHAVVA